MIQMMSFELQEVFGDAGAKRVEQLPHPDQLRLAVQAAAAAAEAAAIDLTVKEASAEEVDRLDSLYLDLRETGDPAWEAAFSRARAAAALLAARDGLVGHAFYEALHAGVSLRQLVALTESPPESTD